jgi:regulatory protein
MAKRDAGKPDKPGKAVAYDKALGLLARREHSIRELKTKLALRGHAKGEASEAIDRLKDQHYQSDDRFAASLTRRRASQGYGPRRIGAELKSHGLGEAAIRVMIAEADLDWTAIALTQSHRRFGTRPPTDSAERAKRADFLLRRGFDPATVRAVTRAEVDDPGQDFD